MHLRPLENFLEAFEVKMFGKNPQNCILIFEILNSILIEFPKNRPFVTFPAIKKDCEVVWSQKLVRSKALTLEHPLDTLNIPFRRLKKFLGAFEFEVVGQKLLKFTSKPRDSSLDFT